VDVKIALSVGLLPADGYSAPGTPGALSEQKDVVQSGMGAPPYVIDFTSACALVTAVAGSVP